MTLVESVRIPSGGTDHLVHFYGCDDELASSVAAFLLRALEAGEAAVMVATAAHRLAIEQHLTATDIDIAGLRASGVFVVLDAAETMQRFLHGDRLDPGLFALVMGGLVQQAAVGGRPVHIYGEMVTLLWDAGQVNLAIELEELWNELGHRVPFSLYCAYPAQAVSGEQVASAFRAVCRLHSAVIGDAQEASAPGVVRGEFGEVTRTFVRTLDAPRAARQFVAETLRSWGDRDLTDDAVLIVTELATNAVVHARSDFTVTVSRAPDVVRISVYDASVVPPSTRAASSDAHSGRGIDIVDTVAYRWDVVPLTAGKAVWAELRRA